MPARALKTLRIDRVFTISLTTQHATIWRVYVCVCLSKESKRQSGTEKEKEGAVCSIMQLQKKVMTQGDEKVSKKRSTTAAIVHVEKWIRATPPLCDSDLQWNEIDWFTTLHGLLLSSY